MQLLPSRRMDAGTYPCKTNQRYLKYFATSVIDSVNKLSMSLMGLHTDEILMIAYVYLL